MYIYIYIYMYISTDTDPHSDPQTRGIATTVLDVNARTIKGKPSLLMTHTGTEQHGVLTVSILRAITAKRTSTH